MWLNNEIIPGKSLGGVCLDEKVDFVVERFSPHYDVKIGDGVVKFNNDLIMLGYDENRLIYSAMCGVGYSHRFSGKLWAGMTVAEVIENSRTQVAWGGCVIVDGINGIGLPLPSGLDDFEVLTDFLEFDYVFPHLSVFRL